MEGHDSGEDGVHYDVISTKNYSTMDQLLEDYSKNNKND